MSTDNEQFRPGFEAWAIGPTGPYGGKVWLRRKDGQYVEDCVEARWQGWLAAKRDASTEPSYEEGAHAVDLMKHLRAKAAGKGYVAIESAIDAAPVLSAALPDEAKECKCWSCKRAYTDEQRANADGNCPHCGVEIDLAAIEAQKGGQHEG